jgi:ABC-2 type transport system permease protein
MAMSPARIALRAGRSRGLIELRQSVTNGGDLFNHFFWPLLMLVTLWFLRDRSFGAAGFPLGALVLPSILGMNTAMAMVSISQQLTADREDGTLLRAKATPHGVLGYLTGKLISVSGSLLIDLAIFLLPALFLVHGLATDRPAAWLTLLAIFALGLVATLPTGAVLGSIFTSARSQGMLTLPVLAVIAISGIFYPITALPGWLQTVAQTFPIYWLGLGMRSALLPPSAVAVEIGHSWRHVEMVAVLGGDKHADRPGSTAPDGPPRVRFQRRGTTRPGTPTGSLTPTPFRSADGAPDARICRRPVVTVRDRSGASSTYGRAAELASRLERGAPVGVEVARGALTPGVHGRGPATARGRRARPRPASWESRRRRSSFAWGSRALAPPCAHGRRRRRSRPDRGASRRHRRGSRSRRSAAVA